MSDVIIGKGKHRYSFRRDWAKLPRGWSFGDDRPSEWARPPQSALQGAVAANGDIYVLARSATPVTVFDPEGNFITAWAGHSFTPFVHGIRIDAVGHVWIADSGRHIVQEFTAEGRLLRSFGSPEFPAPTHGGKPFNMPTGVAFASNGDFYVSDGYGNRRVHCFAADGTLKHSWGEAGSGPGQFSTVHYVAIDKQDRVYITDRENHRIQIFSPDGAHLADWTGFVMPYDLAFGKSTIVVGGDDGVSIWSHARKLLLRIGSDTPYQGAFKIHGLWLDADENIYVAHFDRTVSKLTRLS